HKQILKSGRLQLFVCSLQHFQIGPRFFGKTRRILAPQLGRAILVGNVGVLQTLCLNNVVNAVAGQHDEVRLIVSQVADAVGVLDCEPELLRQLGETLHVLRFLQETRKLLLVLIVTGHEVEDRFPGLHGGPRPRKRRRFGQQSTRVEKLRLQFGNDELSQRLYERLHGDVLSYIAADRLDHRRLLQCDLLAESLGFEELPYLRCERGELRRQLYVLCDAPRIVPDDLFGRLRLWNLVFALDQLLQGDYVITRVLKCLGLKFFLLPWQDGAIEPAYIQFGNLFSKRLLGRENWA